jgi:hypothetical protein
VVNVNILNPGARHLAVVVTALVLAVCGIPSQGVHARGGEMTMVGNMEAYPDLERAGARSVRRARRLQRASLRSARRFDTLAKANGLGYETSHMARPGFVHARKHGPQFWGRMLNPAAPQALVFWCPRHGRCRLTTYMFRARAGSPPTTWRRLLQWHRHGPRGTWMTHVWLLPGTRTAFATCAPWQALERVHGLRQQPYHDHFNTEPCRDRDEHDMSMPGGPIH